MTYDRGALVDVQRMEIAFYRGDKRDAYFGLQASEDGTVWTTLVPNGTPSSQRTLQLQVVWEDGVQRARYLRYIGQGNSENSWVAITEFQVYGLSTPIERIALGVEDVTWEEPGNPAVNSIDDDLATRWSCIGDCVVTYDLGALVDMQRVETAFYRGDKRDAYYGLQASEDGTVWTTLVPNGTPSSQRTLQPQVVWEDGAQRARYLRYIGQGNSENKLGGHHRVSGVRVKPIDVLRSTSTDMLGGENNGGFGRRLFCSEGRIPAVLGRADFGAGAAFSAAK